jgi:hypothetical protein
MNINQTIVDPQGREIFTFGGPDSFGHTEYRGYLVVFDWFIGRRTTEPMMVIQVARAGYGAGALGICLSSIGAYADPSGGPAAGALDRCKGELASLGRARLDMEARMLLDVILHFTPALIAMPPAPMSVRVAESSGPLLEVERQENGKTVAEVTI